MKNTSSVGFHFPKKLWWGWFSSQSCLLACFIVGLAYQGRQEGLLCLDSL
jgi:hypothetical protein